MKLLVIVLNYGPPGFALECLRSLSPELAEIPGAKVVVVDNGSGGEVGQAVSPARCESPAEILRAAIDCNGWRHWATMTALPVNLGFSGGNNVAIRDALTSEDPPDYVLLLNSDTLVDQGAIVALLRFLDGHPAVGIAGSRLESPEGRAQGSPFRFQGIASEIDRGLGVAAVTRLLARWAVVPPKPAAACAVDWVAGASMMIRRAAIESIGLLDDGYFAYFEDMDYCRNAWRAGWEVWYVPESRVVHFQGSSSGVDPGIPEPAPRRRPAYWFEARRRYFLKNRGAVYSALTDAAFLAACACGNLRRSIQGKPNAPGLLPDSLRYSVFLRGFGLRKKTTEPCLICLNIPCYQDGSGRRYFDSLWHKDLMAHLSYLQDVTVAQPLVQTRMPEDAILWNPELSGLRFIDLPDPRNTLEALWQLPGLLAHLWPAVGRAHLIHLGIAGWPIPYGWLVAPLARLRGKPYLVVIESAPWRAVTIHSGLKARLRRRIFETMGRWCVNHAALVIATQQQYLDTLFTRDPLRGHVVQASWIDAEDVLPRVAATALWAQRSADRVPFKLLYAGRLTRAKGLPILLDAMRMLAAEDFPATLDVLGKGELLEDCERMARDLTGLTRVRTLGTLPYGDAFLAVLRDYHAVAVPNISDEQSRIVYDAYSQAMPVLASDTSGLRACVMEGETGRFPKGDHAQDWAALIRECAADFQGLELMGLRALEIARANTHQKMHERRAYLLAKWSAGGIE